MADENETRVSDLERASPDESSKAEEEGGEREKRDRDAQNPLVDEILQPRNVSNEREFSPEANHFAFKENGDNEEDEMSREECDSDDKRNDFVKEARNRVKLYVLAETRTWEDRGTGHVACLPSLVQPGFHCIIVRLEANEKNVLESRIMMDTHYQKQQETLIVWSETETCDLALSFQEKSGCDEIWAKICEVQGKDPRDTESGEELEEADLSDGGNSMVPINGSSVRANPNKPFTGLPPAEMARLSEIEHLLATSNSPYQKEKISSSIENTNYIGKLCDIFRMCEDVENTEGLKSLYNIAKKLFMLNKTGVIEALVSEECLKDVIGMLEYDPAQPSPRPHRDFLYDKARFRQILPMNNPLLKEKIHHTFRVQYLQDVCLPAPSLFEENLLSSLNSHIFFTRHDIVTMLQEDKVLLTELFSQLKSASTGVARRRDLCVFLKELCAMSHQNAPQSKEVFYKTLIQHDILSAVEECMLSPDKETRAATTEMLHMVVVFSAQTVRDFLLRQAKEKADDNDAVLMNILLSHIVSDGDPELSSATQMLQVMRMLLDPDNMGNAQKGEKSEFLSLFYNRCIGCLVSTMEENVKSGAPAKDDYHTAKKQSLVLRLINFCVTHHAYQMRHFLINRNFLNKVLILLKSKHHFLALYALKLLRSVIQQKDDFYVRYVVNKRVFDKVIDCLLSNGRRNNLLNSAIIELFEYIKSEDMKALVRFVADNYVDDGVVDAHHYVKTFINIGLKNSMYKERERDLARSIAEKEEKGVLLGSDKWKKEKEVDKEEQWFDHEEDEEEEGEVDKQKGKEKDKEQDKTDKPPSTLLGRKTGQEPMFPKLKRDATVDEDDEEASVFSGMGGGGSERPNLLSNINSAVNTRILIKVMDCLSARGNPSSPSSAAVPAVSATASAEREDEVSSSVCPAPCTSTVALPEIPKAAVCSSAASPVKKGLVEYDDSDSDEDEEEGGKGQAAKAGTPADSLPSSSTGSPTPDDERGKEREREGDDIEYEEDVSSTSVDGEADSSSTSPPSSLSESAASSSSSASTSPLLNRNGRRKRKESDTELEGSHQDADNDCPQPNPMKRAREDSDATESPACAATAPIESPLSLAAYKVSRSQAEPTSPRNQAPTSPRNHAPSSPSLRPSPPPVDPVAQ